MARKSPANAAHALGLVLSTRLTFTGNCSAKTKSTTNGLKRRRYPVGANEALRKESREFVRWIVDGTEPCLTWREGLRCVEVIEAAPRSASENGAWMTLPLYPELESQAMTEISVQHPEGMPEGSQGQAKRSPWNSPKKKSRPEGDAGHYAANYE